LTATVEVAIVGERQERLCTVVLIGIGARDRAPALWAGVIHDRLVELRVLDREVDPVTTAAEHAQLVPAQRTSIETAALLFRVGIRSRHDAADGVVTVIFGWRSGLY
jgi:hypothetical protein